MAKQRSISTKMWSDSYFEKLDPIEKLLFVYFLTNMYTNICGIYEIPIKLVAVETGIDKEMVLKILQRFENDTRIYYIDGYICIRNFIKNQSNNPSIIKGIEREISEKPKELIDKIESVYNLYTGCIQAVGTKLNLTKLNLTKPTPKKRILDVVGNFDDFYKKINDYNWTHEFPKKNIEIEKQKCWNWWYLNNKKMKNPVLAFKNWLSPKPYDKEYIDGIKEKTDDQRIAEMLQSKNKFNNKYGRDKYQEVKDLWIKRCLAQPLSL